MEEKSVKLELSHDEALVLFELLCRYDKTEQLTVEGAAEEMALWRLQGAFERTLTVLFRDDYVEQVRLARERLREQAGGS